MNEKHSKIELPRLIEGGLSIDDRGQVTFVNDFSFDAVKRFYMVSNHRQGFVRAWHAHKKESKFVLVVSGSAVVAAVKVDDWDKPSKSTEVHRHILSSIKPSVLFIPAGYANGFMTLSEDTQLMFFSTSTLEESKGDDFRYDARHWDVWGIVER